MYGRPDFSNWRDIPITPTTLRAALSVWTARRRHPAKSLTSNSTLLPSGAFLPVVYRGGFFSSLGGGAGLFSA